MEKTAYISPSNGELSITVTRNERPEVTLMLDLGIPNFTVFSLKFPLDEAAPSGMQDMVLEGLSALLDEVSAFMLSLKFDEEVIVTLHATVMHCFGGMTDESDTMNGFSDVSRDPIVETYQGTFRLPIDFIDETQTRVVTARKTIERMPRFRHLELTTVAPHKSEMDDAARIIRQYRSRSLKQQPKPLYVIVYDQRGRPTGTLPLGNNFKNKLWEKVKSSATIMPEMTEALVFETDIDLKLKNANGIPKSISVGDQMFFPEAFAGHDLAMYKCQSEDSHSWVIKFPDGRMIHFADRPSIAALRNKNYAIPSEYWRWNLIRDEGSTLSNEAVEVSSGSFNSERDQAPGF